MSSKSNIAPLTSDEASASPSLPRADFQAHHRLHDSNVTFEEYLYYAAITRAQEARLDLGSNVFEGDPWNFNRKRRQQNDAVDIPIEDANNSPSDSDGKSFQLSHLEQKQNATSQHKAADANRQLHGSRHLISHDEWLQVSRATRNASWSAIFFLITTDIFGPLSVPWALNQLGYGPGVIIYTVFGVLAGYTGYQLWVMFMHLDSDRHPLKTYGDIAFRVYGSWARYTVNVLQSLQLFFSVGLLALSSGQGISQLSSGKLCFVICTLVFCIAGFTLGQIRTLRTFGWLANISIWINVVILCIVMGVVAHSPPNYAAALAQNFAEPGPVVTSAGVPAGNPFEYQVIGMMQAVYSYAGTMLFCEFMSEMRRPWDFWKGMLCAQAFIYLMYMFYGIFVYSYQGQFTILVSNQGLSIYVWQSITNAMGLVSALILACLYGNIGIKVLYSNVGIDLLGFPPLDSRVGKISFAIMVPIYWSLAFVLCSTVPSITNFSGLIAAVCVVQFTYTFPPILLLGFMIKMDSMLPEEAFNPATGEFVRVDHGMKRWWRGMKKRWIFNAWNIVLAMGAAATAVLGIYAGVKELIFVFANNPAITSLSCNNPIGA